MPCSATFFLEMSALISLKVAINGHFRGKNKKHAKKFLFLTLLL